MREGEVAEGGGATTEAPDVSPDTLGTWSTPVPPLALGPHRSFGAVRQAVNNTFQTLLSVTRLGAANLVAACLVRMCPVPVPQV